MQMVTQLIIKMVHTLNLTNKENKQMTNRLSWNEYFMENAYLISKRATCDRLTVGAVIVKDNQLIATGYNGSLSGEPHCNDDSCLTRGGHCIRTIHAEMNALLQCARTGANSNNSTVYVTHFPCLNCMKALLQAGISKIYYAEDYHNDEYAIRLANNLGAELIKYNLH